MTSKFPETKGSEQSSLYSSYKLYAPYLTLGLQLALSIAIFYFIGDWVDTKFGTAPMGKIVGASLGMIGGFIKFFKSVTSMIALEEKNRTNKKT